MRISVSRRVASVLVIVAIVLSALPLPAAAQQLPVITLYALHARHAQASSTESEAFTGNGCWQAVPNTKMELYIDPTQFDSLGTFTVDDIEEISYWTKNSGTTANVDFALEIYTAPYEGGFTGWYGQRLSAEPLYSRNYAAQPNQWNLWSTAEGSNQLVFYDSNHWVAGSTLGPTLSEIQESEGINWQEFYESGHQPTNIDYGEQPVKYIKLSTSTGGNWQDFNGYLDCISISLKDGRGLVINLEGRSRSVWVNDDWSGKAEGEPVDGGYIIGVDAFGSIQEAVSGVADGGTIHVAEGTYAELVTVDKSLCLIGQDPNTTVIKPDCPMGSVITVLGEGVRAEITGFTIEGSQQADDSNFMAGVFVRDGTFCHIHHNVIKNIKDPGESGMQRGVGILVGRQLWNTTGAALIEANRIVGYQKCGVAVDNTGSEASILNNTVEGTGQIDYIAQNGIQVSRGAVAAVTGNTISGHWYTGENWSSAGVLLYEAGDGTTVTGNTIRDNQMGIYTDLRSSYPGVHENEFSDNETDIVVISDNWVAEEVYVDAQYGDVEEGTIICQGKIKGYNAFATIQEAVNRVASGGTVTVTEGTYQETVTLSKSVRLRSQVPHGAEISGTVIIAADNVTVDGFSICNFDKVWNETSGIFIQKGTDIEILNNVIDGQGMSDRRIGILTTTGGNSQATISGNTITNVTTGIYANPSNSLTITSNILEKALAGVGIDSNDPILISGNIIRDNEEGVGIGGQNVIITENRITGNARGVTLYVDLEEGSTTTAVRNWWGHEEGPSREGVHAGDPVVGNVEFDPWYGDEGMQTLRTDRSIYNVTKKTSHNTIQEAVAEASAGDIITVAPGIYAITSTITVDKPLLLKGSGPDQTVLTVDNSVTGSYCIKILADNTTIEGFKVKKTDKAGPQNLIYIQADHVTIKNNEICGQYVLGDPDVSRALEVAYGSTELNITDNVIHSLRQPAYINGSESTPTTGTISNNLVYGTRGWVIDGANMTFEGNIWQFEGEVNYLDIAILSRTPATYYPDIVALSTGNNNALVEDQRTNKLSHVYVDAGAGSDDPDYTGDGTHTCPYTKIADGITRVVDGGKVFVAAGEYAEDLNLKANNVSLLGAKAGVPAGPMKNPPGRGEGESIIDGTLTVKGTGNVVDGFTFIKSGNVINWSAVNGKIANNILAGGTGQNNERAILTGNTDGTVFEHNNIQGYWQGLVLDGGTTAQKSTIAENYIGNAGSTAILLMGSLSNGHEIRGNVVENSATGIVIAQGEHVIKGNALRNLTGCGIYLYATSRTYGNDITGNTIENARYGIYLDGSHDSATGNKAHFNVITGTEYGVYNEHAAVFDASHNWWGTPDGPDQTDTELGSIIEGNVNYRPWYMDETMTVLSNELVLIVDVSGNGTITKDPDKPNYEYGEEVTLTANPGSGWRFSRWTGDTTGTSRAVTVIMNGNKSITAVFKKIPDTTPTSPPAVTPTLPPVIAPSVTETIRAEEGGKISFDDGSTAVEFPQGAAEEDFSATIALVPELTQPVEGFTLIDNTACEVVCETQDGDLVTKFAKPVSVSIVYREESLENIKPEDLKVFYWDVALKAWIALPSVVDTARGTVTAKSDVPGTFALMVKPDMPEMPDIRGHWAEKYVLKMASLDIISGYDDMTFRPDSVVTREQFAKMVVLAAGLEPDETLPLQFTDASEISGWAKGYVAAAVKAGIIQGLGGNRFGPSERVTRAQAVTMIARALGRTDGGTTTGFEDDSEIPEWAVSAVELAVKDHIIDGFEDNTFRPGLHTTRAQAAKMLAQMLSVRASE